MTTALESYALTREEGRSIWFLGKALMTIKATGEQTNGAFSLVEEVLPAGYATIYHAHQTEDEAIYVLEGEITLIRDNQKLKAGPGTYVFLPRRTPHGYRVETAPARLLLLIIPAGFEQFFIEAGEPAKDRITPPPAMPPDREKIMALAAKYNNQILGPLPE
jgi:quercetin dioxygenase-like cupin family protein